MCRIFFSINNPNISNSIFLFLQQSHLHIPNTPYYPKTPPRENQDGFGFAWFAGSAWDSYKNTKVYNEDPNIDKIVKKLHRKKIILGHLRRKLYGKISYENTQPFIYKKYVFMHNGYLSNFTENKSKLLKYVDPELIPEIKGNTDSEIMFFMLVSIFSKNVENIENLIFSIKKLFHILKILEIPNISNVVFSNGAISIACRYQYNMPNHKPYYSLYYDIENGITISSEPVSLHPVLVPKNSMMLINTKDGSYFIHKI
jgi:glutamine amidotransferase